LVIWGCSHTWKLKKPKAHIFMLGGREEREQNVSFPAKKFGKVKKSSYIYDVNKGYMKKRMVIQEHNAVKAGLHWDLRFEKEFTDKNSPMYGEKVLRSFAIPKHKFPEDKEQILAIEVADHAWNWQNFEGNIGPGFWEGSVKCLFKEDVEVERFDDKKIIFQFKGSKYQLHKAAWVGTGKGWIIIKK